MSAVISSAVTIGDTWTDGKLPLKKFVVLDITVVLNGQGSQINPIPASVFGLTTIKRASTMIAQSNLKGYAAGPDTSGANLVIFGGATNVPTDVTDTIKGIIWGYR